MRLLRRHPKKPRVKKVRAKKPHVPKVKKPKVHKPKVHKPRKAHVTHRHVSPHTKARARSATRTGRKRGPTIIRRTTV